MNENGLFFLEYPKERNESEIRVDKDKAEMKREIASCPTE
jgi:hypothetical protein